MGLMKFNGFNKNSVQKVIMDIGAVFVGFDITKSYAENKAAGRCVGALQNGTSFTATPTMQKITVAGIPENTVGLDEVLYWVPTISLNMLEQDAKNLKAAVVAGEVMDVNLGGVGYKKITARGELKETDYQDNVTLAGRIRGSNYPVYVVVEKTLNLGGLGWNFNDRTETLSNPTFTGNYYVSADDTLSDAPWAIYIPDDVDPAAAAAAIAKAGGAEHA